MKTKIQITLAWIVMLTLLGLMLATFYADYQREISEGHIMPVMYP